MQFFKHPPKTLFTTILIGGLLSSTIVRAGALFDELPRCDAPMTIYHVRDGLHTAGPVAVFDIIDVVEVSTRSDVQRKCRGTAITDIDDRTVTFEIGWHDPVSGIPYFRGLLSN